MSRLLVFGSTVFGATFVVLLTLAVALTCTTALAQEPDPIGAAGDCSGCGAVPVCALNGTMDDCVGGCTAVPGGTCDSTCTCKLGRVCVCT